MPEQTAGAAIDPRSLSEFQIHCLVIEHLERRAKPGVLWWHTPNGELRHPTTAAKLKRMGVNPGVADLAVLVGRSVHFLEFKGPGGRLSPAQKAFRERVALQGVTYETAYTLDEALSVLARWGAI